MTYDLQNWVWVNQRGRISIQYPSPTNKHTPQYYSLIEHKANRDKVKFVYFTKEVGTNYNYKGKVQALMRLRNK